MTTKRKRLNVTLSDPVWALVDEVHTLTGTPKSAVISEILDEIAPVFLAQIEALRKLQESPREAQRIMQNFANEAVGQLSQVQLDLDTAISKTEQPGLPLDAGDARTMKGKRAKTGGIRGRTS